MTTVSVCSAKGSPGATTLACAIGAVWPAGRRVVVAECDPAGGDLAARFNLSAKRGMASLALEARRSPASAKLDIDEHLQMLPGGLEILVGPTGAPASRTVDAEFAQCLVRIGSERSESTVVPDLVLDCGRAQPGAVGQSEALRTSRHVLVIARPTVEAVASTRWIAEQLNRLQNRHRPDDEPMDRRDREAGLVLIGSGAVVPSQAAEAIGLPLLTVIPEDRMAAAALRGEPALTWRLARSPLVQSVRALVAGLFGVIDGTASLEPHEQTSVVHGSTGSDTRNGWLVARSIRSSSRSSVLPRRRVQQVGP